MSANLLLREFDRVSEAEGAASRLRRLVLALAVRGRLVPHVGDAGAALVDRISDGRFDLPSELPPGWLRGKLTTICQVSYGCAFDSAWFSPPGRGMPLIRIRDISATDTEAYFDGPFDERYIVQTGDYLVGMDGEFNLRRWRGPRALLNQRVMRLTNWSSGVVAAWVAIPLQMLLDQLQLTASQTTVKHLSARQVANIEVPLPPLEEQHGIIAKVDELTALLDGLHAVQSEQERTGDRVAAAALHRLAADGANSECKRLRAQFYIDNSHRLITRPRHVAGVRTAIIELALTGRLVQPLAGDVPAHLLVSRAAAARNNVTSATRKTRSLTAPVPGDLPTLPSHWSRCRLADIAEIVSGVTKDARRESAAGLIEVPYLRVANVQRGFLDLAHVKTIRVSVEQAQDLRLESGDVLLNEGGDRDKLGRAWIWEGQIEPCIHQNHVFRARQYADTLEPKFLAMHANTFGQQWFIDAGRQTTNLASVSKARLSSFPVPVPPREEQRRIVARVDELMVVCDELQASLGRAQDCRVRALEALLADALAAPAAAGAD